MAEQEKLGQEPAFPALEYNEVGYGDQITLYFDNQRQFIPFTKGMSKRFYAACAAMQGILATSSGLFFNDQQLSLNKQSDIVIKLAYLYADELLKQENL